jgi:hypothetical protein
MKKKHQSQIYKLKIQYNQEITQFQGDYESLN